MAVDLVRLKSEITSDPCALQLKQMWLAGNVQGIVDALNAKCFRFMDDQKWGHAIEAIRSVLEENASLYALALQYLDPPSRARKLFSGNVTVANVNNAMG